MARKNVAGDKGKKTWKFYTILSSIIGVVLIAVVVLLAVLYVEFNTDTYRNRFSEWTEYKINYNELDDKITDEDASHKIFVFVYDDNFFDQEEIDGLDADDPNRSDYIKANEALNKFVEAIKANNTKYPADDSSADTDYRFYRVDFYIINTSLQGNSSVLSNEDYGNASNAPTLLFFNGEEYSETDPNDDKSVIAGGNGSYSVLTQVLTEAREYVEAIKVK